MCGRYRRTTAEEEIARQYHIPIPPQLDLPISYNIAPLYWLERDYLLPLLDGLDEVEITLQPDCVAAINTFIEESESFGTRGLLSAQRVSLAS
jgi:predicted NACHT family NTPase